MKKFSPLKRMCICAVFATLLIFAKFEPTELLGWFPAIAAKLVAVALAARIVYLQNKYEVN